MEGAFAIHMEGESTLHITTVCACVGIFAFGCSLTTASVDQESER